MTDSRLLTQDPRSGRSALRRRGTLLGAMLAIAVLLYASMSILLYNAPPNIEMMFAEAGLASPFNVYVSLIDMDPVREELLVHLDFATIEGPHGQHFPGVPDRDLIVHVGDGNSVQDIALQARRSAVPITLRIALRGSVGDYPLDVYSGRLSVNASDAAEGDPQPVRLTMWPVMSHWTVGVAPTEADLATRTGIGLALRIVRPAPFVVVAVAVYVGMALVGLSALTIGALAYLGIRRIEATLTGSLGAMVFAVPALRGALPGVPPLGGHADVLVFVWVELAVIIGLTLFVITWAQRGPPP